MSSVARTFWRHLKVQESSERHLPTLKITGDIIYLSVNKKDIFKLQFHAKTWNLISTNFM